MKLMTVVMVHHLVGLQVRVVNLVLIVHVMVRLISVVFVVVMEQAVRDV
jgi:hypothetical protein